MSEEKEHLDYLRIVRRLYALVLANNLQDIDFCGNNNFNELVRKDPFLPFFVLCHQLKDWLVETDAASKSDVEALIDASPALRLCADICTKIKHCRPKWSRTGASVDLAIVSSEGRYFLLIDSKRVDALDLARGCLMQWDKFIGEHGLETTAQ